MDHFYDNSLQTGLMRDLAVDIEVLGEHLVLLGNQVSGRTRPMVYCQRFMHSLCYIGSWEE